MMFSPTAEALTGGFLMLPAARRAALDWNIQSLGSAGSSPSWTCQILDEDGYVPVDIEQLGDQGRSKTAPSA